MKQLSKIEVVLLLTHNESIGKCGSKNSYIIKLIETMPPPSLKCKPATMQETCTKRAFRGLVYRNIKTGHISCPISKQLLPSTLQLFHVFHGLEIYSNLHFMPT